MKHTPSHTLVETNSSGLADCTCGKHGKADRPAKRPQFRTFVETVGFENVGEIVGTEHTPEGLIDGHQEDWTRHLRECANDGISPARCAAEYGDSVVWEGGKMVLAFIAPPGGVGPLQVVRFDGMNGPEVLNASASPYEAPLGPDEELKGLASGSPDDESDTDRIYPDASIIDDMLAMWIRIAEETKAAHLAFSRRFQARRSAGEVGSFTTPMVMPSYCAWKQARSSLVDAITMAHLGIEEDSNPEDHSWAGASDGRSFGVIAGDKLYLACHDEKEAADADDEGFKARKLVALPVANIRVLGSDRTAKEAASAVHACEFEAWTAMFRSIPALNRIQMIDKFQELLATRKAEIGG